MVRVTLVLYQIQLGKTKQKQIGIKRIQFKLTLSVVRRHLSSICRNFGIFRHICVLRTLLGSSKPFCYRKCECFVILYRLIHENPTLFKITGVLISL